MTGEKHDLGSGFSYTFTQWSPNRELNPQYVGIPDIDPCGVIIWRGDEAVAHCWFDSPLARQIAGDTPKWELHSLDPLHLEPSIQMYAGIELAPSYHGHIRNGRWEPA